MKKITLMIIMILTVLSTLYIPINQVSNALVYPGFDIGIGINFGSKVRISNSEGKFIELDSKRTTEIPGNLEVIGMTDNDYLEASIMATLNLESSFTIDRISQNHYLGLGIDSCQEYRGCLFYKLKTSNVNRIIITKSSNEVTYTAYGNNIRAKFEGEALTNSIDTIAYSRSIQIFKISKNRAEFFNVDNQVKIKSANTNNVFKINSDYFKIINFNSKKQKAEYQGGRKFKLNSHQWKGLKEFKVTSIDKKNYNFLTFNQVWNVFKGRKQAIGYRIYKKANGEKSYKKLVDLLRDENYFFDTTVTDGKKYSYKIKLLYFWLNPKLYWFDYNTEIPENVWSKRRVFGKATELNARAIFNQTLSKFSNAKKIQIIKKPKTLYQNSKFSITAKVIGTKGKKLTSKKIKFISSNTKYLKINQKGKGRIIKKPKSGKIKVYLRAHNGLQKYITIKVK